MLFSEPKISQPSRQSACCASCVVSVLFSEPKISQPELRHAVEERVSLFQCSSASRKFLNLDFPRNWGLTNSVSVLFSEPKISQHLIPALLDRRGRGFSALQRAENFSTVVDVSLTPVAVGFSALQRAENFSTLSVNVVAVDDLPFQCSSASRKFLNF